MRLKRREGRRREKKAPVRSGDWVFGRRPAPFIVERPAPYRPELWFLLDAGGDQMVAMEAKTPGEPPSAVAEWASARLDSGIRLRVDEASLVEALRLQVGEGIDVQEASTPEDRCGHRVFGSLWQVRPGRAARTPLGRRSRRRREGGLLRGC